MKFSNLETALFGLYNWARQDTSKAIDYQMAFGVKSTLPTDTLLDNITNARRVIKELEFFCTQDELAVLRFYYGFTDRFEDNPEQHLITDLTYPKDKTIGLLIARSWRDEVDNAELIALLKECCVRQAYRMMKAGKDTLAGIRVKLINSDYLLADQLERCITQHQLFK